MNTRHEPARVPETPVLPGPSLTLPHRYQSKDFITSLLSHTSAPLRLYPLCFDTLHKNTGGGVVAPETTAPSRFGREPGSTHNEEGPKSTGPSSLPSQLGASSATRMPVPRKRGETQDPPAQNEDEVPGLCHLPKHCMLRRLDIEWWPRSEVQSEVKPKIGALLIRRTQCHHVRYF